MRKLVIFLYFVFLFKLAFAQSLPSIPSFKELSGIEPAAGTDVAQIPEMPSLGEDDNSLPTDLDLPTTDDKKAESEPAQPVTAPEALPASVPETTANIDIEAPSLEAPAVELPKTDTAAATSAESVATEAKTLQPAELPNEFEAPALPPTADSGSTPEVPQAEVKDLPKLPDQTPETTATLDNSPAKEEGSVMDQIESESVEKTEFPEMPDLNYEKNKKLVHKDKTEEANQPSLTPEDREKEVDSLLDQVFDKGKTKEQIEAEKAQAEADSKVEKEEKQAQQNDSPLLEKVVDVSEQPVKAIDELQTDDDEQYDLTELPASMRKDSSSVSPFIETTRARNVYTSSTYSEQQLSSMLVSAAMAGNKNFVVQLINSGRDPNSQNAYGETALMGAVYNGRNDIVEVLLSEGANPDIRDNKGNSPLLVAAAKNNVQAAQQLIKAGADIDHSNNASDTPLLVSTLNNNIDVLNTLLQHGADINKTNGDGLTALHIAAYNSNTPMVRYLLSMGANPNITAKGGHKALDLAKDPESKQLIASYAQKQQKSMEARMATTQPQKSYDSQYAMYPSDYVETPAQQVEPSVQSNWWAAKNNPAEKVSSSQSYEQADYSANDVQQLPASLAYKNMSAVQTPAPAQYQAPVVEQKKWTKLTVDHQTVNTTPQQAVNMTPASAYMPQQTVATTQQPAAPQALVRAVYDANGNLANTQQSIQAPAQAPQPAVSYQNIQPVFQAPAVPASMNKRVSANNYPVAPAAPVNNYPRQSQQKVSVVPQQQYILPQGPISNNININVPKYAELDPSKQAVWDMKLAQWVKDGMTINAKSQGERIFWLKQQKVLEAVYQEQFNIKVESMKRKLTGALFNSSPVSKSVAGAVVTSRPVKLSSSSPSVKTSAADSEYLSVYTSSN